jgi:hypothetical protein
MNIKGNQISVKDLDSFTSWNFVLMAPPRHSGQDALEQEKVLEVLYILDPDF